MTSPEITGRLASRCALVTGASRGIGLAIVRAYLAEGASVLLTARDAERLKEVAQSLDAVDRVTTHACDVTDPQQLEQLFAAAVEWRGGVDILVNNAGIYIGKPFTDYSFEEFDQLQKTNVYSVFRLMQLALVHMQPRGAGKIVNIASTAGKWESANQAAYNASKHAVVGLTRCAALENGVHRININAICPGMVNTDMWADFGGHAERTGVTMDQLKAGILGRIPLGRFIEPEEVAHIAVYLGSAESDGMTGQTITISGGMRMG